MLGARRVGVGDGDALEPAVAEDVDHAPVGEVGHREPRHPAQRLLVVERAGEHAPGLGQQPLGLLGLLEVGDVLDDVDRAGHACRRRSASAAPSRATSAISPVARHAVADGQRLGLLARERAPPRELVERERPAVLVEHLEAAGELVPGRRRAAQRGPVGRGSPSSRTAASLT